MFARIAQTKEDGMGIKKLVTLTCDGPCGTVVNFGSGTVTYPPGWTKLLLSLYEKLKEGQKPTKKPTHTWLCPKCSDRFQGLMNQQGFAMNEKADEEEKS